MANYTNVTALAAAIEVCAAAGADAALVEKLTAMHTTASKPRKSSKQSGPTKEQMKSDAKIREIIEVMDS